MSGTPKFSPVFNLFCRDIEAQSAFYQSILGWSDVPEATSPIYRALAQDGTRLAFHSREAYALLDLEARERGFGSAQQLATLLTFVIEDHRAIEGIAQKVVALGGRITKPAFATYYHHWQIVFEDPEGNIARISATSLPIGAKVPKLAH